MTRSPEIRRERRLPSRMDAIVFCGKTTLLRIRRAGVDLVGRRVRRHTEDSRLSNEAIIAISKTPLWTETDPRERFLVAGKIHNLRLAIDRLNKLEIQARMTFS